MYYLQIGLGIVSITSVLFSLIYMPFLGLKVYSEKIEKSVAMKKGFAMIFIAFWSMAMTSVVANMQQSWNLLTWIELIWISTVTASFIAGALSWSFFNRWSRKPTNKTLH